jgi:hypothetical protein
MGFLMDLLSLNFGGNIQGKPAKYMLLKKMKMNVMITLSAKTVMIILVLATPNDANVIRNRRKLEIIRQAQ